MAEDTGQNPGTEGQPTGQPTSSTQQPQNQPAPSTSGTPAPAQNQPGQDDARRQAGILADLQKERQARQAIQRQLEQHQAELAAERKRVQALAGVNPKSEADAEVDQIRERFAQVFPGLAKLSDEQVERLLAMSESAQTLEQTTEHYWQSHGRFMVTSVEQEIAKEIGGNLSDRQIRNIRAAYIAAAQNDPEFLRRHEDGDPQLISEFAKEWVEDWFEPARRKVTAAAVGQGRPVPSGRDRSIVQPSGKKIDFKNEKSVEDAMVEAFKTHGGSFDR